MCTNVPRYQCTADHASPRDLPTCSEGAPSSVNDLIAASRFLKPKGRPIAAYLSRLLPPLETEEQNFVLNAFMRDAIRYYWSQPAVGIYCRECGGLTVVAYTIATSAKEVSSIFAQGAMNKGSAVGTWNIVWLRWRLSEGSELKSTDNDVPLDVWRGGSVLHSNLTIPKQAVNGPATILLSIY